jgi:hypothetical protein
MNPSITTAARVADIVTLIVATILFLFGVIVSAYLSLAIGLIVGAATLTALIKPELSIVMRWVTLAAGILLALILLIAMIFLEFVLLSLGVPPTATGATIFIILLLNSIPPGVFVGQIFVPRIPMRGVQPINPAPQNVVVVPPAAMPAPAPAALLPQPMPPTQIRQPQQLANAWVVNMQTNQNYQLLRGETRLGRSKERNNVVLPSSRVSREHALIREMNGRFVLYEVGAQQQVYVNNQPVRRQHVLEQQDVIQLGDIQLRFIQG